MEVQIKYRKYNIVDIGDLGISSVLFHLKAIKQFQVPMIEKHQSI